MTTSSNVDLNICVNGNKLAEFAKDSRFYVEAKEGYEYNLRLRNNNPFRIKAVITIDGVSILTGNPINGDSAEIGYILGPHETQTFHGYRLDNNNVAAFKFTKAESGYAKAEKGLSSTSGVIGLRVWREQEAPKTVIKEVHHHHDYWHDYWPYYKPYRYWWSSYDGQLSDGGSYLGGGTQSCNNILRGASAQSRSMDSAPVMAMCSNTSFDAAPVDNPFNAASTFGSKIESSIREVEFKVGAFLGEALLYYAFRNGLEAMGIDLTKHQKVTLPDAFPGKYATPPKGWQG